MPIDHMRGIHGSISVQQLQVIYFSIYRIWGFPFTFHFLWTDRYQAWLQEQGQLKSPKDAQRGMMAELETKLDTPRAASGNFYRPMSERAIDSALESAPVYDKPITPDEVRIVRYCY